MKLVLFVLVLTASVTTTFAKQWRGLVPLKSTRADTERVLGTPTSKTEHTAYYKLPYDLVVIHFQTTGCDPFGLNWDIPVNTVVNIAVIPRRSDPKEEYLVGGNFRADEYNDRFRYYDDETAGQSIETYDDFVTLVDYYPTAADERLRCPRIQRCCVDPMPLFDEYQGLKFRDEVARLDNFLIQLNAHTARGVIAVVGPSAKARQEAWKRALRAKSYLVKKRRLEPERLLIVDGGYRTETATRLLLYPIGGLMSRIYVFPQRDP